MAERIVVNNESQVPALKRIGIIGGMGQWATLDIVRRILKAAVNHPIPQYGNRGYPLMDIRMLNRAPMILNPDGSYPEILEPSPELLAAARFVGENTDVIIIGSNTAHIFSEQVEAESGKPVLSLIELAVNEAKRRGLRRVGILSIGLTVEKQLFQEPLRAAGIESVVLPVDLMKRLDDEAIYPIQEGGNPEEYQKVGIEMIEALRSYNVEAIILGCSELPILLGERAEESDIINPSELVAQKAVQML